MRRLAGRTALITGGSRGIGRAIAAACAAAGADVVISSRREEHLREAVDEIVTRHAGARVSAVVANAGDDVAAAACVEEVLRRHGRVDILVNNAATNPYQGDLAGITRSAAEKTVAVNQFGVVRWTQLVHEAYMARSGGTVLNIASVGGLSVDRSIGYYNATKAAVLHLTRQLAWELAPGVRVNAIAPGLVKTDMARALWEPREAELASLMPLRRIGIAEDIAAAALFLVSDDAAWITGATLVVDGGASVVPVDIGLERPGDDT